MCLVYGECEEKIDFVRKVIFLLFRLDALEFQ